MILQASQQIAALEAQRTELMKLLQSVQAINKQQAELLTNQKAAMQHNSELAQIEQLEDAIQQAQEVRCTNCNGGHVVIPAR